jgi:hypothetical protein
MEYLDERDEVIQSDSPKSLRDIYEQHCRENGLEIRKLD